MRADIILRHVTKYGDTCQNIATSDILLRQNLGFISEIASNGPHISVRRGKKPRLGPEGLLIQTGTVLCVTEGRQRNGSKSCIKCQFSTQNQAGRVRIHVRERGIERKTQKLARHCSKSARNGPHIHARGAEILSRAQSAPRALMEGRRISQKFQNFR